MIRQRLAAIGRELARIRYRLLLINVLTVAVPIVGIGFARFYEREMLRGLEDDMIHQAQLLREVLLADPSLELHRYEPLLARAARDTRTRIRLLDAHGALTADSHRGGPPEGPEHSPPRRLGLIDRDIDDEPPAAPQALPVDRRREVQAALNGRYGSATRYWDRRDRVYLFSAVPVTTDGEVVAVIYVTRSTTPVKFALYRLRTTLFVVLLVSLAATTVLSLFFAATIARPLARLTTATRRIAGGERRVPLGLRRADEIGELARAIERMAHELDQRARGARELAAEVTHELKSPLTSIRGAAELLCDGADADPRARRRFLRNIVADANRLDRTVSRLLELARVEHDEGEVVRVDCAALVRAAAERSRGPARVMVEAHGDVVTRGRPAQLASILDNLLDNAQVHAAAGSVITVTAAREGDHVRLAVHNRGEPIDPARLPRIWDRFHTTRGRSGGTGLGLAIVASAARAHGGTADVVSDAERTCFTVRLPAG